MIAAERGARRQRIAGRLSLMSSGAMVMCSRSAGRFQEHRDGRAAALDEDVVAAARSSCSTSPASTRPPDLVQRDDRRAADVLSS
jgi:hypothetical protein